VTSVYYDSDGEMMLFSKIVWVISRHKYSLGALFITTILAYGLFYAPVLYGDDWSQIVGQMVQGKLEWIDWTNRRPLLDAPLIVLHNMFGINIPLFYLTAVLLTFFSSVAIYFLVLGVLPENNLMSLTISLLILIYPADYTHIWLAHALHARVAWLLTLLFAGSTLFYAERGKFLFLLLGTTLLTISLLLYEAQLGIAISWCLFLMLVKSTDHWSRRLAFLLPILVIVIWAGWRGSVYDVSDMSDNYLPLLEFKPVDLFHRVGLGLKVMIFAWTLPLRRLFKVQSNWIPLVGICLFIAATWFLVLVFDNSSKSNLKRGWLTRLLQAKKYVLLFGLGIFLSIAGYFPSILLYQPNLKGRFSRVNFCAIPGASLCIVSLLCIAALILKQGKEQALLLAGAAPLIALGIFTQAWVHRDFKTTWWEQKHIWNSLFRLVPDMKDDTVVYFVLPGYEDRIGFANWQRTPLTAQWEVSSALQVLYGKKRLYGDLIFTDINIYGEARVTRNGVVNFWTGESIPYERSLFVAYDGEPRKLRIISDLQNELVDYPTPSYAPYKRVMEFGPTPQLRRLVNMSSDEFIGRVEKASEE
jgi:hypothetical protein